MRIRHAIRLDVPPVRKTSDVRIAGGVGQAAALVRVAAGLRKALATKRRNQARV